MAYQTPLTVKDTLDQVARGDLVLPAIQREYVWVSDQSRMTRLFDSLLRKYPIGTFLFWSIPAEQSRDFDFYTVMRDWHDRDQRHNPRVHLTGPRSLKAVLDGQQRITTLNIGLYGSLTQRAKYKRATSIDAYPVKHLYLDLLFEPGPDDDIEYRFDFLTGEQATAAKESHWYRVGQIADVVTDPLMYILEYTQSNNFANPQQPARALTRLHQAVHQDGVVSAFEEKGERLDRVLDIFVRVNSGGVVLSKSDLLLSMATTHFKTRDARDEVHRLVDDLNAEGAGFSFSKDMVLKAGLVMTGISDISFRVDNFTAANMATLEENWDRLSIALRLAAQLLSSFGLSAKTLPANSVLIPVADYLYSRGLAQTYLDSQSQAPLQDRRSIRGWVLRTILMPGIWGSGLDQLLRGLHRVISESTGSFPVRALEDEMARRGKDLDFSDALIDELITTPYKHARTFALLTMLYETVDTLSRFEVDHVFPRALATRSKLLAAGVSATDIDDFRDKIDRLPNLQLLHGPVNLDKRAQMPATWLRTRYPNPHARDALLAENDLDELPDSFVDFGSFFSRRRELMRARLVRLLGTQTPSSNRLTDPTENATFDQPDRDRIGPHAPREPRATQSRPEPAPTRHHPREQLTDLLADGRLTSGQVLYADHRGRRYEAIVEQRGLFFAGALYPSPTAAGQAVTGGSVNGWKIWKLPNGKAISDLRRD